MIIENKFEIGQTVYLVTDSDQLPRLVYGFEITQGSIIYMLCIGTITSNHFDFEISEQENIISKTTN